MAPAAIAEWIDDGFLHPPVTIPNEFVDIVVGPEGAESRSVLENFFRRRHPDARQVFLSSVTTGEVIVSGETLAEVDAFAVAATQFACAWNESAQIAVRDDRHAFVVTVAYRDDKYFLSAEAPR